MTFAVVIWLRSVVSSASDRDSWQESSTIMAMVGQRIAKNAKFLWKGYQNRLQDSFVRKIPTIAILQVVPMVQGAQNLHCPSSFDSLQTPVPTWHPTGNGEVHIVCRHQLCKTRPATRDSLSAKNVFLQGGSLDMSSKRTSQLEGDHCSNDYVGCTPPCKRFSGGDTCHTNHASEPASNTIRCTWTSASGVCQNSQSLSG